jgi:prophage maintenance system killer protein
MGEESREYDGLTLHKLDRHLELASYVIGDENDAGDVAASLALQLARSSAFHTGTLRTALVACAMLFELNHARPPADWMACVDLLEDAGYRVPNLGKAHQQLQDFFTRAAA